MRPPATIPEWLSNLAAGQPQAVALVGVDRPDLSYHQLVEEVGKVGSRLRGHGVRARDVVLVAVSDGPEALVALLGVASVATAFPVSTSEQPERYQRIFDEISVAAVICDDRLEPLFRRAVAGRGVLLLSLAADPRSASGVFTLRTDAAFAEDGSPATAPAATDPALLIATSGSTGAPKIVSVSHESVFASVEQFAGALELSPRDRSLCVMPMTHLHSLLRSILPCVFAGGSVACMRGFSRRDVLGWIEHLRPTYLSAAPSVHRSLLDAARVGGWRAERAPSLRLLVTGSDAIDASTVDGLAAVFAVPLFQFYVLSETAPVIAMTTADDAAARKPVLRINPTWSVASVDDDGNALPAGTEGEIAVVGGTINPLFTGRDFVDRRLTADGRLRTGDRGMVVGDILSLTGRVDDRIQRGGEKISPHAIEEILLQRADIERAVAFGVPDPALGQRIAAAVVPKGGASVAESDLQLFVAKQLDGYMVPEKILVVDDLPASELGKSVPRSRLAAAFGVAGVVPAPKLVSAVEESLAPSASLVDATPVLAQIFGERLGLDEVDLEASFFDLGGDSFAAIEMLAEIEDRFGVRVPPAIFAGHPSVSALGAFFAREGRRRVTARILPVRAEGRLPPLFIAHNVGGDVGFGTTMAMALGGDQPVYATYSLTGANEAAGPERMEEQAAALVEAIRSVQPHGPYYLIGYSFGAHLALEIAQQFLDAREPIAFLGVIDDSADLERRHFNTENERAAKLTTQARNEWALRRYVPKPFPGAITLFRSTDPPEAYQSDPFAGWADIAIDGVEAHDIGGDHASVVTAKGFGWGGQLSICLAKARLRARADNERAGGERAKALRRARSLSSSRTVRHTVQARIAAKAGDHQTEIREYRRALQVDPAQPLWVRRNLAEALIGEGNIDAALQQLEAAVQLDPWPLPAMVRVAELMARHDRGALEMVYQRARELVAYDADTIANWAQICRFAGKREEAEAAFRRAIELQLDKAQGTEKLEHLYGHLSNHLAEAGRTAEALAAANHALHLNPISPQNRRRVAGLMARGAAPVGLAVSR